MDIEDIFRPYLPTGPTVNVYSDLYRAFTEISFKVDKLCLASREKALACTKLEESAMWAVAAISRNG